MIFLSAPIDENNQPFDAGEVFETCVSMVRKRTLKRQLRAIRSVVETEAADYDAKASRKLLCHKHPHVLVGTVNGIELVKVYTDRMVSKKSKGRHIYDRIMSVPVHGKCPLCGVGTVNTLDHYLPKGNFPVFSVTPNNLVPACSWCQRAKSEYYPITAGGQLFHPYFDDIDNEVWLGAEVVEGVPASFRFFASPPEQWPQTEKDRAAAHLRELNLPVLFSLNAGSRLSEIRARLASLYQQGGADAVREHLNEELASIEANYMNSWTAAMYRASVANDWFCNGGFLGT